MAFVTEIGKTTAAPLELIEQPEPAPIKKKRRKNQTATETKQKMEPKSNS